MIRRTDRPDIAEYGYPTYADAVRADRSTEARNAYLWKLAGAQMRQAFTEAGLLGDSGSDR